MTNSVEESSKSGGSEADSSMSRQLHLESVESFSKDGELVITSSDVLEWLAEFEKVFWSFWNTV